MISERCWDRCLFILLLLGEVGDDAVVVVESLAVVVVEVASTATEVEDPLYLGALLPLEKEESIVCWRWRSI